MNAPTVAVLRSEARALPLGRALADAGAVPVFCALMAQELLPGAERGPLLASLQRLSEGGFAWVAFTSVTTVQALLATQAEAGGSATTLSVAAGTSVAAVGEATARALAAAGVAVQLIPAAEHSARGLLASWPPATDTTNAEVFLPASDLAAATLRDGLLERGWQPTALHAYRTVDAPGNPALELATAVPGEKPAAPLPGAAHLTPQDLADALASGLLDLAVLTSPSTARRVRELLGERDSVTGYLAIGPRTAAEATSLGLRVEAVATTTDPAGLAGALAAREAVASERNMS